MRKFIRNSLLIIFLVALLVTPAYSESNKIEHPIIIIAAGAPIEEYTFFIQLLERAGVSADVAYDLHTRVVPALFKKFPIGEIESGKYKTAIFVFGAIGYDYYDTNSIYIQSVKIEEVIKDLNFKIDLCQQNGIRMVGLQCYFGQKYNDSKDYTIRVIEEIVPLMDSLLALYCFGDFPEVGDKFLEVGKENGISIEYFTDSESSPNSYSGVVQILSMKFGE